MGNRGGDMLLLRRNLVKIFTVFLIVSAIAFLLRSSTPSSLYNLHEHGSDWEEKVKVASELKLATENAANLLQRPCQGVETQGPSSSSSGSSTLAVKSQQNFRSVAENDNTLFAPGSLQMSKAEVLSKCYVPTEYYEQHFGNKEALGPLCAVSRSHSVMYFHIPKSGSSTSRKVFNQVFQGKDSQHCPISMQGYADFQKVAIVREPLGRFYAGYDEAFARVLNQIQAGHPSPVPGWLRGPWRGLPTFKHYEKIFDTPETLRRFESFVATWDGRTVFNEHLNFQTPLLSNPKTGIPYPMDFVGETSKMVEAWDGIGALTNTNVDHSISSMRGRAFPRRFNVTEVSATTVQRICRLAALDYCCLNFPLPPACLPENSPPGYQIYCQWVDKPEIDPSGKSTRFIEPFIG